MPLKITRNVSVKECSRLEGYSRTIIIMGPTGAGKIAFIEALAGDSQTLGISKDQLDSFTQEVRAYELKNATFSWDGEDRWPIYMIDTPGFSDRYI